MEMLQKLKQAKDSYEERRFNFAHYTCETIQEVTDFLRDEYKLVDLEDEVLDEYRREWMDDDGKIRGKEAYDYTNAEIESMLTEEQLERYIEFINENKKLFLGSGVPGGGNGQTCGGASTELKEKLEQAKRSFEERKYNFAMVHKAPLVQDVANFLREEYKLSDVEKRFLNQFRERWQDEEGNINGRDSYSYSTKEIEEMLNDDEIEEFIAYINNRKVEYFSS